MYAPGSSATSTSRRASACPRPAAGRPRRPANASMRCSRYLGSPQLEYPAVHLTGTNGKTSTAADGDASCSARSASRSVRTRARIWNASTNASRIRGYPSPTTSSTSLLRTVAIVEDALDLASVVLRGAHRGRVLVVRGPRGRRRRRRGRTRRHVGRDELARHPRRRDHQRRGRPRRLPRPDPRGDRGREGGHRATRLDARPRRDRSRARALLHSTARRRRCCAATSTSVCATTSLAVGGRLVDLYTPTASYADVLRAAARRAPSRQRRDRAHGRGGVPRCATRSRGRRRRVRPRPVARAGSSWCAGSRS